MAMKILAKKQITAALDVVAQHIEERGMPKAAAQLDLVANLLDAPNVRIAQVPDTEPGNPADEAARLDGFNVAAADMHKMPVGANNVGGEVFGRKNAKDSDPAFASTDPVNIQAGRRRAENVNIADLAERGLDKDLYDTGDASDDFSTGALPETGHDPSLDDDQEGGELEAFGTQPEGSIHASRRMLAVKRHLEASVKGGVLSVNEAKQVYARACRKALGNEQNLAPTSLESAETMDKANGFATAQTLPPNQVSASILQRFPAPRKIVPAALDNVWVAAVKQTRKAGRKITQPEVLRRYRGILSSAAAR